MAWNKNARGRATSHHEVGRSKQFNFLMGNRWRPYHQPSKAREFRKSYLVKESHWMPHHQPPRDWESTKQIICARRCQTLSEACRHFSVSRGTGAELIVMALGSLWYASRSLKRRRKNKRTQMFSFPYMLALRWHGGFILSIDQNRHRPCPCPSPEEASFVATSLASPA